METNNQFDYRIELPSDIAKGVNSYINGIITTTSNMNAETLEIVDKEKSITGMLPVASITQQARDAEKYSLVQQYKNVTSMFDNNQARSVNQQKLSEIKPFVISKNYGNYISGADNTKIASSWEGVRKGSTILNKFGASTIQGLAGQIVSLNTSKRLDSGFAQDMVKFADAVIERNKTFFTESQYRDFQKNNGFNPGSFLFWDTFLPNLGFTVGGMLPQIAMEQAATWAASAILPPLGFAGAFASVAKNLTKIFSKSFRMLDKIDDTMDAIQAARITADANKAFQTTTKYMTLAGQGLKFTAGTAIRNELSANGEAWIEANAAYNQLLNDSYTSLLQRNGVIDKETLAKVKETAEFNREAVFHANKNLLRITNSVDNFILTKYLNPLYYTKLGTAAGIFSPVKVLKNGAKTKLAKRGIMMGAGIFLTEGLLSAGMNAFEEVAQGAYSELARRRGYDFYTVEDNSKIELLDMVVNNGLSVMNTEWRSEYLNQFQNDPEARVGAVHGALTGILMPLLFKGVGGIKERVLKTYLKDKYQTTDERLTKAIENYNNAADPFTLFTNVTGKIIDRHLNTIKTAKQLELANESGDIFSIDNITAKHLFEMALYAENVGSSSFSVEVLNEWKNISEEDFKKLFPDMEFNSENKLKFSQYVDNLIHFTQDAVKNIELSRYSFNPYKQHAKANLNEEEQLENKKYALYQEALLEQAYMTSMFNNMEFRLIRNLKEIDDSTGNSNITKMISKITTPGGIDSYIEEVKTQMREAKTEYDTLLSASEFGDKTVDASIKDSIVKANKLYENRKNLISSLLEIKDALVNNLKSNEELLKKETLGFNAIEDTDLQSIHTILAYGVEFENLNGNTVTMSDSPNSLSYSNSIQIPQKLVGDVFYIVKLRQNMQLLYADKEQFMTNEGIDRYINKKLELAEEYSKLTGTEKSVFDKKIFDEEIETFNNILINNGYDEEMHEVSFGQDGINYMSLKLNGERVYLGLKLHDVKGFEYPVVGGTVYMIDSPSDFITEDEIITYKVEDVDRKYPVNVPIKEVIDLFKNKFSISEQAYQEAYSKNNKSLMKSFLSEEDVNGFIFELNVNRGGSQPKTTTVKGKDSRGREVDIVTSEYGVFTYKFKDGLFYDGATPKKDEDGKEIKPDQDEEYNKVIREYSQFKLFHDNLRTIFKDGKPNKYFIEVKSDGTIIIKNEEILKAFGLEDDATEISLVGPDKTTYTVYEIKKDTLEEANAFVNELVSKEDSLIPVLNAANIKMSESYNKISMMTATRTVTVLQVNNYFSLVNEKGQIINFETRDEKGYPKYKKAEFKTKEDLLREVFNIGTVTAIGRDGDFRAKVKQLNKDIITYNLGSPSTKENKNSVSKLAHTFTYYRNQKTAKINTLLTSLGLELNEDNRKAIIKNLHDIFDNLDSAYKQLHKLTQELKRLNSDDVFNNIFENEGQAGIDNLTANSQRINDLIEAQKEYINKEIENLTQNEIFDNKLTVEQILDVVTDFSYFSQKAMYQKYISDIWKSVENLSDFDTEAVKKIMLDKITQENLDSIYSALTELADNLDLSEEANVKKYEDISEQVSRIKTEGVSYLESLTDKELSKLISSVGKILKTEVIAFAELGMYEHTEQSVGTSSDMFKDSIDGTTSAKVNIDINNMTFNNAHIHINTLVQLFTAVENIENAIGDSILGLRSTLLSRSATLHSDPQDNIDYLGKRISPFDDTLKYDNGFSEVKPNHPFQTTGRDVITDPIIEYDPKTKQNVIVREAVYNPEMEHYYEFLDKYGYSLARNNAKIVYLTLDRMEEVYPDMFTQVSEDLKAKGHDVDLLRKEAIYTIIADSEAKPIKYKDKFLISSVYTASSKFEEDTSGNENQWFRASTITAGIQVLKIFKGVFEAEFNNNRSIDSTIALRAITILDENQGKPFERYSEEDKKFLNDNKALLIKMIQSFYDIFYEDLYHKVNGLTSKDKLISADVETITNGIIYTATNKNLNFENDGVFKQVIKQAGYEDNAEGKKQFEEENELTVVKSKHGYNFIEYTPEGETNKKLIRVTITPGQAVVVNKKSGDVMVVNTKNLDSKSLLAPILYIIGNSNQNDYIELDRPEMIAGKKGSTRINVFPKFKSEHKRVSLLTNMVNWGNQNDFDGKKKRRSMRVDFENNLFNFTDNKGTRYSVPREAIAELARIAFEHNSGDSSYKYITSLIDKVGLDSMPDSIKNNKDAVKALLVMFKNTKMNILTENLKSKFIFPVLEKNKEGKLELKQKNYSNQFKYLIETYQLVNYALPTQTGRVAHQRSLIPKVNSNGSLIVKLIDRKEGTATLDNLAAKKSTGYKVISLDENKKELEILKKAEAEAKAKKEAEEKAKAAGTASTKAAVSTVKPLAAVDSSSSSAKTNDILIKLDVSLNAASYSSISKDVVKKVVKGLIDNGVVELNNTTEEFFEKFFTINDKITLSEIAEPYGITDNNLILSQVQLVRKADKKELEDVKNLIIDAYKISSTKSSAAASLLAAAASPVAATSTTGTAGVPPVVIAAAASTSASSAPPAASASLNFHDNYDELFDNGEVRKALETSTLANAIKTPLIAYLDSNNDVSVLRANTKKYESLKKVIQKAYPKSKDFILSLTSLNELGITKNCK